MNADSIQSVVKLIFVFSLMWGCGGNLSHVCHNEFDTFFREHTASVTTIPPAGLCFEYFVDLHSSPVDLMNWNAAVPDFIYNKDAPYFSMLVPTMDTCRFSYLLDVCLDVERSVLFTGAPLSLLSPLGGLSLLHLTRQLQALH